MAEQLLVECARCEATVAAEPEGSYSALLDEHGMPEMFSLLKCPKCDRPLLVGREFYGNQGGREVWSDAYRLYPVRSDHVNPQIPPVVRWAHREAHQCFRAKAFTAAAIMCRRTLEAICHQHGVKEGTLARALPDMRDRGLIEGRLFEWADALRLAGNAAAHDVESRVTRDDARDLLEFTTALLEYVYTFRDKFEEFKSRQAGATA